MRQPEIARPGPDIAPEELKERRQYLAVLVPLARKGDLRSARRLRKNDQGLWEIGPPPATQLGAVPQVA